MRTESDLQVEVVKVVNDEIVVSLAKSQFSVTYYKPDKSPQLLAKRISDHQNGPVSSRPRLKANKLLVIFATSRRSKRSLLPKCEWSCFYWLGLFVWRVRPTLRPLLIMDMNSPGGGRHRARHSIRME
jgi:hypothetical protein